MFVVRWRTTILGIMITASSVVIIYLLYIQLVYVLRQVARFGRTLLL
jgi:hypothetical protein